jgi:hypothetical protein
VLGCHRKLLLAQYKGGFAIEKSVNEDDRVASLEVPSTMCMFACRNANCLWWSKLHQEKGPLGLSAANMSDMEETVPAEAMAEEGLLDWMRGRVSIPGFMR